jgi:hypothetical protein
MPGWPSEARQRFRGRGHIINIGTDSMTISSISIREARLQLRGMRSAAVACRAYIAGVLGMPTADAVKHELTSIGTQVDNLIDDCEVIDGTLAGGLPSDMPPAND